VDISVAVSSSALQVPECDKKNWDTYDERGWILLVRSTAPTRAENKSHLNMAKKYGRKRM
jgi:hypothetical protein